MKKLRPLSLICFLFFLTSCAQYHGPEIQNEQSPKYIAKPIIEGIDIPWGMDFISQDEMLVTEKSGILYRVSDGNKTEVSGLPEVYVRGQGGLLDVAIAPSFETSKLVFFTSKFKRWRGTKVGIQLLYSAQLRR